MAESEEEDQQHICINNMNNIINLHSFEYHIAIQPTHARVTCRWSESQQKVVKAATQ